jgi:drug/metabolite transporter (DMT)-like permease
VAALLCWASTVPVIRSLSESIGACQAGAIGLSVAGALGLCQYVADPATRPTRCPAWRTRLAACGGLFVAYQVALLLAVAWAHGRREVLVVGALNYLWPVLALVLSVPILGHRCSSWIVPGSLLAIVGEVLVVADGTVGTETLGTSWGTRRLGVYVLAAVAAVSWAVYSNLTRRLAGDTRANPVPVFLLLSGLVLAPWCLLFPAGAGWTAGTAWELAFLALVPSLLAYSLWDQAMARGQATLVTVASYFTPVLSAGLSCLYLSIRAGWLFWIGTALLVAGAAVSYLAFARAPGRPRSRPSG